MARRFALTAGSVPTLPRYYQAHYACHIPE
jgi:hypothetical protein